MNDYIKMIGSETLITVGCGAIIDDDKNRILLQRRKDQNNWSLPGGVMEVNENFSGVLKQEGEESFEHRFFDRTELPEPLNSNQASFILDWAEGKGDKVIVK